jgi:hypothetical protein
MQKAEPNLFLISIPSKFHITNNIYILYNIQKARDLTLTFLWILKNKSGRVISYFFVIQLSIHLFLNFKI